MKNKLLKNQLKLKERQQTNQTEESLLANQKVGKRSILMVYLTKMYQKFFAQCLSFRNHLHLGPTYINVIMYFADGSQGNHQHGNKQVDVFGSGNNIAETINTDINPIIRDDDGE